MMPKFIVDKLIKVMEKLFADLAENFDTAGRNCRNNDASSALYEASSAVNAMDVPYIIREALEIPHGDTTPAVGDFKV